METDSLGQASAIHPHMSLGTTYSTLENNFISFIMILIMSYALYVPCSYCYIL